MAWMVTVHVARGQFELGDLPARCALSDGPAETHLHLATSRTLWWLPVIVLSSLLAVALRHPLPGSMALIAYAVATFLTPRPAHRLLPLSGAASRTLRRQRGTTVLAGGCAWMLMLGGAATVTAVAVVAGLVMLAIATGLLARDALRIRAHLEGDGGWVRLHGVDPAFASAVQRATGETSLPD